MYFFVNSFLYNRKLHFLLYKKHPAGCALVFPETLEHPVSVTEYLKACNYVPVQVVVELNEEIIKRENYDTTVLKDGDVVEILHFMGGGSF